MSSPFIGGLFQGLDSSGNPLSGGLLYTYAAGTLTDQATYTTAALSVANANPVVLNSSGFPTSGGVWPNPLLTYRYVLKTSAGVTVYDVDNVSDVIDVYRVSVKDPRYGAVGNGSTDDTDAIQAAIDANPGKTIWFPDGSYKVTGTITVSANSTRLAGTGATIIQYTADIDTFLFAPTTAGTSAAYLSSVSITGLNTYNNATNTSGAAVRFLQCNSYRAENCILNESAEGLTIQGGQFGTIRGVTLFASIGAYGGSRSALFHIRQAPIGGGSYQPAYTVEISGMKCGATLLRESCVLVSNGDGIAFSNCYMAKGYNAVVTAQAERDNSYISSLTFENCYLDGVNQTTGSNWGVWIPADGFASSYVYHVFIGNTCTIGNTVQSGVLCRKPETYDLRIGGQILNTSTWGIDVEGSTSRTNLVVTAKLSNTGTSGGIRANSLMSLSVSSVFTSITTACIITSGTIGKGTITGCVNNSNVADWADSATWTYGVTTSGNVSRYSVGTQSFCGTRTQNFAVADPTVLDWYAEGTFTPDLTFDGASVGMTSSGYGSWTRIGNRVTFHVGVQLTAKGSSTGNVWINASPYNSADSGFGTAVSVRAHNMAATVGDTSLSASVQSNSTVIQIYKQSSGDVVALTDADFTDTSLIVVSGTYEV